MKTCKILLQLDGVHEYWRSDKICFCLSGLRPFLPANVICNDGSLIDLIVSKEPLPESSAAAIHHGILSKKVLNGRSYWSITANISKRGLVSTTRSNRFFEELTADNNYNVWFKIERV